MSEEVELPGDSDSPFKGYQKKQKKSLGEGKQKKALATGFYIKDGKSFFIKKSVQYPADDLAEVAASRLLEKVIPQNTISYSRVKHTNGSFYIASEVLEGFNTLKESVLLPDSVAGADLITEENKKVVFNKLEPQKQKGLASVLAASLWIRDLDTQYGNLLIGEKPGEIKKFDHGWALASICQPEHAAVQLFEKKAPFSLKKEGTHSGMGIPTNHFNDYPGIVQSTEFVHAIEGVIQQAGGEAGIKKVVSEILQDIEKDYPKSERQKAFELFREHIGFDKNAVNLPGTSENLKEIIENELTARLGERLISMKILKELLKINLALQGKYEDGADKNKKILEAASELNDIIKNDCQNNYNAMVKLIPYFEPPVEKLMKEAIQVLESQSQKNTELISTCKKISGESPPMVFGRKISTGKLREAVKDVLRSVKKRPKG